MKSLWNGHHFVMTLPLVACSLSRQAFWFPSALLGPAFQTFLSLPTLATMHDCDRETSSF